MPDEIVRVGVGVLVMNAEGKILLGKRKSKLGEGTFSLPGGHLEFGETPEECAKRELKEETDLDGSDFEVISLSNDIAYEKHYITIGVIVRKFSGEVKIMEVDKLESWDWYDVKKLPAPLFFPSAEFIDNFLQNIFYK
ncbi:MAG: NUDIX domain-containing protein [Candidatus Paceibacterota bacterium]